MLSEYLNYFETSPGLVIQDWCLHLKISHINSAELSSIHLIWLMKCLLQFSYYCAYMLALTFTLLVAPEEMDWDKNGTVTFKEFLFAFTRWVGIDNEDEDDDDEDEWACQQLKIRRSELAISALRRPPEASSSTSTIWQSKVAVHISLVSSWW